MRTLHLILPVLLVTLLASTLKAADDDSTKVEKKIVKTIVITDDGKTTTDSTFVYDGDEVKVLVRTLCDSFPMHKGMRHRVITKPGGNAMFWSDDDEVNYNVTVETDGDSSKVWVMKGPKGKMKEYRFKSGDIPREHMMMFDDSDFPEALQIRKEIRQQKSGLIDLNDPDIVSFEKETLKNGNEKITIIRKGDK